MDGFKDSTKVQYMKGGKVGTKGAAKIAKVMGEFKRGELHSGSKKGPEVTSRKQAVAIAMSEAGKKPVKKAGGGAVTDRELAMLKGPKVSKSAGLGQVTDRELAMMEGISTRPVDAKGRRMRMEMKPTPETPRLAKGLGAIDAALKAVKAARKGVPAHSNKPMLERAKGGLACMPKRGK